MPDEPRYLLLKRGLYYRPNNQGYTGIKENAGRYTKAEGDALADCGVTAVHEDDADEFSAACYHDVARAHLEAKLAQVKADRDKYRDALKAIKQAVADGRVCDDVAWFSKIETLYDYIDGVLSPPAALGDLFAGQVTA